MVVLEDITRSASKRTLKLNSVRSTERKPTKDKLSGSTAFDLKVLFDTYFKKPTKQELNYMIKQDVK
jgi:hypothetical protein